MPLLPRNTNLDRNAARYCQDMINIATPRLKLDAPMETGTASPVPDLGDNLATFLAARLSGSFDNLNCKNYGLTNPVTLTTRRQRRGDRRDVQHHAAEGQRQHGRRERPPSPPWRRAPQLVGRLHAGPERARVAR